MRGVSKGIKIQHLWEVVPLYVTLCFFLSGDFQTIFVAESLNNCAINLLQKAWASTLLLSRSNTAGAQHCSHTRFNTAVTSFLACGQQEPLSPLWLLWAWSELRDCLQTSDIRRGIHPLVKLFLGRRGLGRIWIWLERPWRRSSSAQT